MLFFCYETSAALLFQKLFLPLFPFTQWFVKPETGEPRDIISRSRFGERRRGLQTVPYSGANSEPGTTRSAAGRRAICIVVSAPITLNAFLQLHLTALVRHYSVTVVGNFDGAANLDKIPTQVQLITVPITRRIDPWSDVRALCQLYRILRSRRFDLVQTVTPKAAMIGMLAARLARIPHRIHWFTGQVWVTRRGIARLILKNIDGFMASLCTRHLVDSRSQRDFLVEHGISTFSRSTVLGDGSISGVDLTRFHPDWNARNRVRKELGIPQEDIVLLFLGRLSVDKGVLDLARAFARTTSKCDRSWLVLVGPDEDQLRETVRGLCASRVDRLRFVDYTSDPARYYQAADIFTLPSYREGFGTSVIEAAACGVPAIGSRIYGLTDAIEEGVTGLLHSPGDANGLRLLLDQLLDDAPLRKSLGEAAFNRAKARFAAERVTGEFIEYYARIMSENASEPAH